MVQQSEKYMPISKDDLPTSSYMTERAACTAVSELGLAGLSTPAQMDSKPLYRVRVRESKYTWRKKSRVRAEHAF